MKKTKWKCGKKKLFYSIGLVWLFSFAVNAFSGELTSGLIPQLVESYLKRSPLLPEFSLNLPLKQTMKMQEEFVKDISKTLGPRIGYKAGLTNSAIQKRFGISHPLRGVLLKKMLLQNGVVLPKNFAARPMVEGDLIVRVGSDEINKAATRMDALAALDAVVPFIELPDLIYAKGVNVNASMIVASNIGARYGVSGEPIALAPTKEWERRLVDMELDILDENGNKVASGKGDSLLGHPLNVVLWLKDSLKAEGKRLKKGDLLSLGALTRMMPVKSGSRIRARYKGLNPRGPVEVSVRFE